MLETFPYLQHAGNLAATLSLYETGLLRISYALDKHTGIALETFKEPGTVKFYKHIERCLASKGSILEDFEHLQQVRVAYKIRNAIIHASGILLYSRQRNDLKKIVDERLYITQEHRDKNLDVMNGEKLVAIEMTNEGEQLRLSPYYVWHLSDYCSKLLTDICDVFLM